jgi:hypothetical protein
MIISSNLLGIMRQLGYGAFYKAALSGDTLEIAGFSSVDDTDLTQSQTPTVTTAEEVLEKIEEGLDTWEGLVKASGGALSNEKSCWWYVDFLFDHKQFRDHPFRQQLLATCLTSSFSLATLNRPGQTRSLGASAPRDLLTAPSSISIPIV